MSIGAILLAILIALPIDLVLSRRLKLSNGESALFGFGLGTAAYVLASTQIAVTS
jgi:hypothetical protein